MADEQLTWIAFVLIGLQCIGILLLVLCVRQFGAYAERREQKIQDDVDNLHRQRHETVLDSEEP